MTVAAVESVGHLLALNLLEELRRWIPGLQVSMTTGHSHQVVQLVLDGVAKVGFTANTETYGGLETVPLFTTPVRCVVNSGHPVLECRPCAVADLSAHSVVLSPWGAGWTDYANSQSAYHRIWWYRAAMGRLPDLCG